MLVVDARSFRSAELPEPSPIDSPQFLAASFDPTRSMLGQVQLARLEHDLLDAQSKGITWKFVNISVPIQNFGPILAATATRATRRSVTSCSSSSTTITSRTSSSYRPRPTRIQ
jgi:phosphodiesterase/alkaline phosphatase D-like protein